MFACKLEVYLDWDTIQRLHNSPMLSNVPREYSKAVFLTVRATYVLEWIARVLVKMRTLVCGIRISDGVTQKLALLTSSAEDSWTSHLRANASAKGKLSPGKGYFTFLNFGECPVERYTLFPEGDVKIPESSEKEPEIRGTQLAPCLYPSLAKERFPLYLSLLWTVPRK